MKIYVNVMFDWFNDGATNKYDVENKISWKYVNRSTTVNWWN